MIYIKELKKPSDDCFDFYLSNGEVLNYKKMISSEYKYYLSNLKGTNHLLFDRLGFIGNEKNKFVSKIVGYEVQNSWPEVKSEKDLIRVIHALCAYNNPKSSKVDSIVEEYPVLPSEVLSFYNSDKTEVTFKKLNVTYEFYPSISGGVWWCPKDPTDERPESYIFTQLKIKYKNKWVEDILGYRPCGGTGELAFPEAKTKEDAYKVMDALILEYIKQQFQPKTTIKTNNYGDSKIELRRKKADVRVGSCPAGSIVHGKRGKTSVRGGRVSYQTCIGN